MSIPLDALTAAAAAIIGSLSVYAGNKVQAHKTSQTENRKLDLDEFEVFKRSYLDTIQEFRQRYDEQEEKMDKVEHLLRLALQHIRDLRTEMRQHDITPAHQAPDELETLLWTFGQTAAQGE